MNIEKFEEFISQYPIYEYRLLDTKGIGIEQRVRTICREECQRYDSTWACPPAVGTLEECEKKIQILSSGYIFFQCCRSLGYYEYGRNAVHQTCT